MKIEHKLEGSCECKAVKWTYIGEVKTATLCNCTLCRRYGAIWIYGYEGVGDEIEVTGETQTYERDPFSLKFHFCKNCGCLVKWSQKKVSKSGRRKCSLNIRLINDPEKVMSLAIDHFDGLDAFDYLPEDDMCVKDVWF